MSHSTIRLAITRFLLFAVLGGIAGCTQQDRPATQSVPEVVRLPNNPIILPEMLPGHDGANINGPSLISVPSWVEGALGRYYLYFAHHIGSYIRLAYSDDLAGPWTLHGPGVLRIENTACNNVDPSSNGDIRHIASPDVHVDAESRLIRMYFHCPVYISGPPESDDSYTQVTFVATSSDGLDFRTGTEQLGDYYFRVFQWGGYHYALARAGALFRSADGLSVFEKGPTLFSPNMRHSAVTVRDGKLLVFYSIIGDNPERIVLSEIEMADDWLTWSETDPVVILEPEFEWEGANLPQQPSVRGNATERVRQLRDPALFEENGRTYLLYSIAGESGIAIAEVHWR